MSTNRLARFFLIVIGDRMPVVPGKRRPLELSQSELAFLLDAHRPKISKAPGKLDETGAIDRVFCDPARLAHLDGYHA